VIATRQELHRLVDQLDPHDLVAAARYLEFLRSTAHRSKVPPFLANAAVEDEPVTPEEEAAVAEAWEDVAKGSVHSHDEVRRRFNANQ
jgi:hypothetical protein